MERQKQRAHEWVENKDIVWRALIPTVIKAVFLFFLFVIVGTIMGFGGAGWYARGFSGGSLLIFLSVVVLPILYVLAVRSIFRDECRAQLRMRGYDV